MKSLEYLVLGGGGRRGLLHVGSLVALRQLGVLRREKLKGIAGTSVGALVAVMFAAGVQGEGLVRHALTFDPFKHDTCMQNILKGGTGAARASPAALKQFIIWGGVADTSLVQKAINEGLKDAGVDPEEAIGELEARAGMRVHIELFSRSQRKVVPAPRIMEVGKALLGAIAIPNIIPPVDGEYMDAGLHGSIHTSTFCRYDPSGEHTLGITLENVHSGEVADWNRMSFMQRQVEIFQAIFMGSTEHAAKRTPCLVLRLASDLPILGLRDPKRDRIAIWEGFLLTLGQVEVQPLE